MAHSSHLIQKFGNTAPPTPPQTTHCLLFLHRQITPHNIIPNSTEPKIATAPSMQYFWKSLGSIAFAFLLPSTPEGTILYVSVSCTLLVISQEV